MQIELNQESIDAAIDRIVEASASELDISDRIHRRVAERVEELLQQKAGKAVDEALKAEMERLLSAQVQPVDIFGERTGKPTTIREQLGVKAKAFWETKLGNDGKEVSWGGTERYKVLMSQLLNDAFKEAVKSNADTIVAEFKKAMLVEGQRIVVENINRLIR